ncbi:aminoglycoside N(3)-acetyltransferase [Bailinhaonella thermotolerans]|uniref:Aminoglycoside N(3)-acetyltransferase n=2 Tax=Bailinhaonella thermotolerans TaxID=1070861 RepID=A0A3A4AZ98_9ACTN|nr:aminoglycoside N(3)-acetyltransferase [Bailinhaonella thermotolerans]
MGLAAGDLVLAHASLRSVGRIDGGAETLVGALREVIGSDGTVVVPTFTPENSDTSRLFLESTRGMTAEQVAAHRAVMPPFDPAATPSRYCGYLTEFVRTRPEAVRSAHPQTSFAALGPAAARLMAGHHLEDHLGSRSPLTKLYEENARVLMIGAGYGTCTAFHLAEYRYIPSPPRRRYACVIEKDGAPTWHSYLDVVLDDGDFAVCGQAMESRVKVRKGKVGAAETRAFRLRDAVDFAEIWMRENRPAA